MSNDKQFRCRINTPDETVFDGDVEGLVLPGEEGSFGVLYNHTPYMAVLGPGTIKIEEADSERELACGGGFAEIRDNSVTILAETAELPEDLDRDTVEETLSNAKETLQSSEEILDDHEREELRQTIEREKARLKVLEK